MTLTTPRSDAHLDTGNQFSDIGAAVAVLDTVKSGKGGHDGQTVANAVRYLLSSGWDESRISTRAGRQDSWASFIKDYYVNGHLNGHKSETPRPDAAAPLTLENDRAVNSDTSRNMEAALAVIDGIKAHHDYERSIVINAIQSLRHGNWTHSEISKRAGKSPSWSSVALTNHSNPRKTRKPKVPTNPVDLPNPVPQSKPQQPTISIDDKDAALEVLANVKAGQQTDNVIIVTAIQCLRLNRWQFSTISKEAGQTTSWASEFFFRNRALITPLGAERALPNTGPGVPDTKTRCPSPVPQEKPTDANKEIRGSNTDAELIGLVSALEVLPVLHPPDDEDQPSSSELAEIVSGGPSVAPIIDMGILELVLQRIGDEIAFLDSITQGDFLECFRRQDVDRLIAILTTFSLVQKRVRKKLADVGAPSKMTDLLREKRYSVPPFFATVERLLKNGFDPRKAASARASQLP